MGASRSSSAATAVTLFPTAIGACALAYRGGAVVAVQLPERSEEATLERLRARAAVAEAAGRPPAAVGRAIAALQRLLGGDRAAHAALAAVPVVLDGLPPFRQRVYQALREVPPGRTIGYGELAQRAGSPAAARAVGQAMAHNPLPLLVPCHRVVGATGAPVGFSAFGGVVTKARLLEIEGAAPGDLFAGSHQLGYSPRRALKHLAAADKAMARLIERAGPFRLKLRGLDSLFESLSQSIIYQQLSGKAAATIHGRVRALFDGGRMHPEGALALGEAQLRGAGLSAAKLRSIRDLADKVLSGAVPETAALRQMDDEEIVERLTAVRGIGRWTVEMLLIFGLGRPDVLPVSDLAVRKGFRLVVRGQGMPSPAEMMARAERWRPYRSVASWYLWRAVDLDRGDKD